MFTGFALQQAMEVELDYGGMVLQEHTHSRNFALQCKNVSMSIFSGLRLALFLEAMLPAAEKRRSDGVEVPGMHK